MTKAKGSYHPHHLRSDGACPLCGSVKTPRTHSQNASGHLWFELLAKELNDAGFTVNSEEILKLPVPWSKESVKEFLFKPVMNKLYPDKHSTAQLTKQEWSFVVEALNLALAERTGIHVDYPSEDYDG